MDRRYAAAYAYLASLPDDAFTKLPHHNIHLISNILHGLNTHHRRCPGHGYR